MGVNGLVHKVLTEVGIRPERFNLQWASAAEAPRFVKLITDYTQQIKALGPLGQAEGLTPEEAKARVQKALNLVSDRKLRVGFGNVTKTMRLEGDIGLPCGVRWSDRQTHAELAPDEGIGAKVLGSDGIADRVLTQKPWYR